MSKRAREDDSPATTASATQGSDVNMADVSGGDSGSGGNGGSRGSNHIFHPHRPMKLENSHTLNFTKHFYVKLYANDWIKYVPEGGGIVDVLGFMTVIPYQALCMYLSPNEYLDIVRNNAYARIENANFQLEFKAVRTPFDTNTTDQAEANGNLQFEIQRWDGLESVMPFDTVDIEGITPPGKNPEVTQPQSYIELINRLYGISFSSDNGNQQRFPATMRERGLSYRPRWRFSQAPGQTSFGDMFRVVNKYISSIPIGEYVTDALNTNQAKMGEGYCFNKSYKPKNGLLAMASSAHDVAHDNVTNSFTQINTKTQMTDQGVRGQATIVDCQYATRWSQEKYNVLSADAVANVDVMNPEAEASGVQVKTTNGECMVMPALDVGNQCENTDTNHIKVSGQKIKEIFTTTPTVQASVITNPVTVPATNNVYDCLGFGYQDGIEYYTTANLENYTSFTSNNERPVHHMPSMLIGAIPKTNKDNTIVNATLEFEIRTNITVKANNVHPTYMNMSIDTLGEAGAKGTWVDPAFNTDPRMSRNYFYAGKWFHNEKDVSLREPKFWHLNYGRAGKPRFINLPTDVPSFTK